MFADAFSELRMATSSFSKLVVWFLFGRVAYMGSLQLRHLLGREIHTVVVAWF